MPHFAEGQGECFLSKMHLTFHTKSISVTSAGTKASGDLQKLLQKPGELRGE